MGLSATTDHGRITEVLDRVIEADPVQNTIFGTVVSSLGQAWCGWDGTGAVAARSDLAHPVTMTTWPSGEIAELAALVEGLPGLRAVSGPVDTVESLVAQMSRPVGHVVSQRLFRCDEVVPPAGVDGSPRVATATDRALVRDWFVEFMAEAVADGEDANRAADAALDSADSVWLWLAADGTPVSLARARTAFGGSARIGPVYTPQGWRGHGYASAATAAATSQIIAAGAIPVLFTDLANPVSNVIYPRLGYRPVADFRNVGFGR